MIERKGKSILLLFMISFMLVATTASIITNVNNDAISIDTGDSDDSKDLTDKSELLEDEIPEPAATTGAQRIDFGFARSGTLAFPLNIDLFGYYVHTYTQIDAGFDLTLPIEIDVDYEEYYNQSDANDVTIDMTIPDNQARLEVYVDTSFDISWHVPGVKDGSANLIDWHWIWGWNFTTPIGKTNLDFAAVKIPIPVTIYGYHVGTFYIILTPQIISEIRAELLSNPNFYESLKLLWETTGSKTITLTAKKVAPDAPGWVTVTIGNFEYVISLGIEWSVEFEFAGVLNIINKFLDAIGYPLKYTFGTWPKIEIGALPSDDEVDLLINIASGSENGLGWDSAIGRDAEELLTTPEDIVIPNGIDTYYTFKVLKDWEYDFQLSGGTLGSVQANIYDGNKQAVNGTSGSSNPRSCSFTANADSNYYIVFIDGTDNTITMEFTDIYWPGCDKAHAKSLSYPYEGDHGQIYHDDDDMWYEFSGTSGQLVSFWVYKFDDADNLELYLENNGGIVCSQSTTSTDNMTSLSFLLNETGTWYLNVKGETINAGEGYYWLDYGKSASGSGYDIDNAIDISSLLPATDYNGQALGPELDTQGGIWLEMPCYNDNNYTFTFGCDPDGVYDYEIYDSDKSTIIGQGNINGSAETFELSCYRTGIRYFHILPYLGGFSYTFSYDSEAIIYAGETNSRPQVIDDNWVVDAGIPNVAGWGSNSYWTQMYLEKGNKVILKLDFDKGDDYDLYIYDSLGVTIKKSTQTKNNPELLAYNPPESGWYVIRMAREAGTGNFTLTAVSADELPEKLEGDVVPGNVYYYVDLKKGEVLKIDLEYEGYRSAYNGLYIYDSELEELDKDGRGPKVAVDFKAPESGYYYVCLSNEKIGESSYSGTAEVVPIPVDTIDLLTVLAISIPIIAGLVVVVGVVRDKRVNGNWFWQRTMVRYRAGKVKQKVVNKKDRAAYKLHKAKSSIAEKVDDVKTASAAKQIMQGKRPLPEAAVFEESFEDDLKPKEKAFLQNLKFSEKAEQFNKILDDYIDEELTWEDFKALKDIRFRDTDDTDFKKLFDKYQEEKSKNSD